MLSGLCWACASHASFGGLPTWLLPCLGAATPLVGFALARRGRPDAADALQAFVAASGLLLLAVARALAQTPCALCLAFWTLQGLLTLELLFSARPTARAAFALVAVAALCGTALDGVPAARDEVENLLPPPREAAQGLALGTGEPEGLGLPRDGLVAFATHCAPCARNSLAPALRAVARGRPVTLVVPPGAEGLARDVPCAVVRPLDAEAYARFGLRPDGVPHLFVFAHGRVAFSATAADARLEAKYVP